jgi:hypothetical protein
MMIDSPYGAALPHNAGATFQGQEPEQDPTSLWTGPVWGHDDYINQLPVNQRKLAGIKWKEDGGQRLILTPLRWYEGPIVPAAVGLVGGALLGMFVLRQQKRR